MSQRLFRRGMEWRRSRDVKVQSIREQLRAEGADRSAFAGGGS